jgi:tetratricopeptide (TPR) repeat protein
MPTLSLCLIARNEESNLTSCLESTYELADEILVVDTGSTDRTIEVARSFGAKVVEIPWEDDFSVPRNRALTEATGDWVFMQDADERLAAESRPILRALIAGTSADAINVRIKNIPGVEALFEARSHWTVRLFRRVTGIRFEGRVHEQIVPSIRRAGGTVLPRSGIVIHHFGCAEPGPKRQERQERDLRLLLMEVAERPKDALARYHLGVTCQSMNRIREAADQLQQALDLSVGQQAALSLDLQSKAHTRLAQLYLAQNELETAIKHCERAVGCGSDDPLTFFLAAVVHMHTCNFGTAATVLEHGLEVAGADDELTLESGVRSDQLRLALAHCKRLGGHLEEAIPQYRTCTENDPDNLDAWIGLAECETQRRNFSQAKGAFRRALELDPESETAQEGLALCGCGTDG